MTKALYRDPAYRQALTYWTTYMATHPWTCRRCHHPIPAAQRNAWDLGHPAPFEPEHTFCNRSAGGRHGRQQQLGIRRSRTW